MMNQEIKKKWIEALRSGDYKQGRGWLRDHDGNYCCLGVLMEVQDVDDDASWVPSVPKFELLAGLDPNVADTLIALNDGISNGGQVMKLHSFTEIADYLEKETGI
jgi:hypothetical protein